MATPEMSADVTLAVNGVSAIVGSVSVPVTTSTGEAADGEVTVEFHVDHAGLMANIAGLLRAVADEFEHTPLTGPTDHLGGAGWLIPSTSPSSPAQ